MCDVQRPGPFRRALAVVAESVLEAQSERAWQKARQQGEGHWDKDEAFSRPEYRRLAEDSAEIAFELRDELQKLHASTGESRVSQTRDRWLRPDIHVSGTFAADGSLEEGSRYIKKDEDTFDLTMITSLDDGRLRIERTIQEDGRGGGYGGQQTVLNASVGADQEIDGLYIYRR